MEKNTFSYTSELALGPEKGLEAQRRADMLLRGAECPQTYGYIGTPKFLERIYIYIYSLSPQSLLKLGMFGLELDTPELQ